MIRRVIVRLSTNRVATQVRKWSEKKIQDQGKVREFYFESVKINILMKSQENLTRLI